MAGRLIWLLALREMGRRLSLQSFRYVYGIQIPFCFWHMHTPFLFHRLIYSFLLCPKTTGGYGHLHPVPDERTFQSDFYTVQLQYFHLLLQALLRLPLLFPQKRPDKGHRHFSNTFKFFCCVKAAKLSSISISSYGNRKCSKITVVIIGKVFCQKDQSCTGGKYRHPRFYFFF